MWNVKALFMQITGFGQEKEEIEETVIVERRGREKGIDRREIKKYAKKEQKRKLR